MPFNPGRSTIAETKNLFSPERFSDSQPSIPHYISAPANLPETSKHPCNRLSNVPESSKHACEKLSGLPERPKHCCDKVSGLPER